MGQPSLVATSGSEPAAIRWENDTSIVPRCRARLKSATIECMVRPDGVGLYPDLETENMRVWLH